MRRQIVIGLMLITGLLAQHVQAAEQRVVIGFRPQALEQREKHDKVHRIGGKIRRDHGFINAVSAELPQEAIAQLKHDPSVAFIEEDRLFSVVVPAPGPTPPSAEYAASWGVLRIGADVAARSGIRGGGVKVAILDSGIDYNHPDLKANYRGGYNFAYDNEDPFDDTRLGHGTHVAGILAAKDNDTGVAGVAPDAWIYALKVLNGGMMGSTSDILAAIEWAINNHMQVINMSFGIPYDPLNVPQSVQAACDKAYQAGIIIVAATGNANQPMVDYPAAFSSVIAVAATNRDDTRYSLANYGAKVELAAPGVDITSTIPGGGYAILSGTSQAVPHVAGVAALLLSTGIAEHHDHGKIVDLVRSRLSKTAEDLGGPGRDVYFGYGLAKAPGSDTSTRNRRGLDDDDFNISIRQEVVERWILRESGAFP